MFNGKDFAFYGNIYLIYRKVRVYIVREDKVEFYAGKIILGNLEMIYKGFKKQYKNKVLMKIDYPVANSYFQKISSIVGEEKMLIIPINPSKTA